MATNLENLENLENLNNCQNLRENSEKKLNFYRKSWKTRGKCKICDTIANENISQRIFPLLSRPGKYLKLPSKSQGKLGEFSASKIWPPRNIIITLQSRSHAIFVRNRAVAILQGRMTSSISWYVDLLLGGQSEPQHSLASLTRPADGFLISGTSDPGYWLGNFLLGKLVNFSIQVLISIREFLRWCKA